MFAPPDNALLTETWVRIGGGVPMTYETDVNEVRLILGNAEAPLTMTATLAGLDNLEQLIIDSRKALLAERGHCGTPEETGR